MGAIGGMLGLGGGASGTGFAAPQKAGLLQPFTSQQITDAAGSTNYTMAQQQQLLQALQQQNGIGNQNQVYSQLQGVANGTGPNPAQAQYQQNVQDLAKQQAGAIASMKGISPALQAQMISQQGSAAQQNAAAAGATNLANQQLNAMNAAGNIAGQQAGNQIGQTNANTNAAQANQNMYQQAAANFNNAQNGSQGSVNAGNAALASKGMEGQQGFIGGLMNGAGAVFGAEGGVVGSTMPPAPVFAGTNGPQSKFGQFLTGMSNGVSAPAAAPADQAPTSGAAALRQGSSNMVQGIGKMFAKKPGTGLSAGAGESVAPAGMVPGTMFAAKGGMTHDYRSGGGVQAKSPDQKAVKSGNSYANDKIPAVLSEGEVVIPRNIMQGPDPARGAAQFVQAVLAKKRVK